MGERQTEAVSSEAYSSSSTVQQEAEATVLRILGDELSVSLAQGHRVEFGGSHMEPDGMTEDGSVVVEVFARIGVLKGGQRHKVSTDALKLLAIRELHPDARLILAFADQNAAGSVSGWKAETLRRQGIELRTVNLGEEERALIEAAQAKQQMVNAS
jgi:hypothetical protein